MFSVHLTEPDRVALWIVATERGWHEAARALALACPVERRLLDGECACHPHHQRSAA